ncbi:MAG: hypothetical protein JNK60_13605 [Acidobacteria bacterium]|nr:hypothetical protein [Acidobacteriota bacterium]
MEPPILLGLRVYELYLLVLERTGAMPRILSAGLPVPVEHRASWLAIGISAAVLLVYAALASGDDPRVRWYRATTFGTGVLLPVLGLRFVQTPYRAPLAGLALVLLVLASVAHRLLTSRRKEGPAAKFIERVRWLLEAAGFALFLVATVLYLRDGSVSVALAFWALYLLRLATVDLIDPPRFTERLGLNTSALRDLKTAAGKTGRKPKPATRARRGARGFLKLVLIAVWLVMPLLAALAPEEVRRGEWPKEALLLNLYPPLALALTASWLLGRSLLDLREEPLAALRGAVVSVATLVFLALAYLAPGFAHYQDRLAGLVVAEAVCGFLFGAVRRG